MSTEDVVLGYMAVIGANIFFGSFGVPIKIPSVLDAKVDPVIYQTYKTVAVFVTSWLVLTYTEFTFTWWGFVGASMWVPNGVLAIIAIRYAGLGAAQGLWSGITVWVSFVWGASLLHEPVNSWPVAVIALILLAVGIGGVAFTNAAGKELKRTERMDSSQDRQSKLPADDTEAQSAISETSSCVGSVQVDTRSDSDGVEGLDPVAESDVLDLEEKDAFNDDSEEVTIEEVDASAAVTPWHKVTKWLQSLSYQVVGIMCAAFIGFSNGTMMLPLSYAPPEAQGITYIVSFGIGALGITAGLLLVYFSFHFAIGRPLPSFHVKVAAAPALLTGVLWAAGNYCSIYATLYLGQTIGYPLVQCNLLVAGLWGIFYYHEIRGWFLVSCFLLWTTIVLVGVFMLSLAG